jgi:TolA-binding protein
LGRLLPAFSQGVTMRLLRFAGLLLFLLPAAGLAQKKEIQDLQRDFGLLQMDVRTLQRSFDEKVATLTVLLQQTLDSANKANTSIALLEREVKDRLREQEKTVAAPVAGLGAKVDTMADEFRFVKESVTEMNSRLNRLQTQMTELDMAIKTLSAPPAPPGGAAAAPGASPLALFDNAMRDKLAGRSDLALQQFHDYVRGFPATEQACEAQFYIGEIYANRDELERAIQAFDTVLEKYPSTCAKKPDAHFMKAKTLAKAGERTAAVTEFREMLKRYPTGDWADKANAELKTLGFRSATPAPSRKRK